MCMDHFTPIELRTHTSEPVPTLLYDSREQNEGCGQTFSEKSCKKWAEDAKLSLEGGCTLINRLLEQEEAE